MQLTRTLLDSFEYAPARIEIDIATRLVLFSIQVRCGTYAYRFVIWGY